MKKIKIECDNCNNYTEIKKKNGKYKCIYCNHIIKFEILEAKKIKNNKGK